jgi:hypothetical protein
MNQRHRIGLVLVFFAVCGVALIVQRLIDARRAPTAPAELYEVVRQHIADFREAEFERAYRRVSAGFQEKCDLGAFVDLVRREYPDLRAIERIEFGRTASDGRHAVVQVYFFLPDGDVLPCIYALVREDDIWRIDAARVQKRTPAGRRLGGVRS